MSLYCIRRLFVFSLGLVLLPTTLSLKTSAQTPIFTPGNLVVTVEGCGVYGGTCNSVPNGTGNGTGNSSVGGYGDNQGAPLTLFQFKPTGTSSLSYVNSLVLPQKGFAANLPVSGEYGSSSEGGLQLTGTGQYLTLMGYGIGAATFDAAPATYGAAPSLALAQSGSLTGQSYTPVSRVVSFIDPYGNVNSSTAIYNIFNTNNPRSAYSLTGSGSIYVSGQGSGSDATGGVFLVPFEATTTTPTAITGLDTSSKTLSQDTRFVQIYNNTLYVSVDSKGGSGNTRDFVGTLGTPPATGLFNSQAGPTQLVSQNNASSPTAVTSNGKLVLQPSEANGINNSVYTGSGSTGTVNLSPVNYYFANLYTMYVADSGNSKQTSATSTLGAGGLQKWVNSKTDGTGTWTFVYNLYSGLNLVANTSGNGTSGVYGVAGVVSGSNVNLYVTNYTLSDLDPTYIYGITDVLAATTNPGEVFTQLVAAPPDSNFKGISFAPTLPAGSATITTVPSGLSFTTSGTGCAPGTYTSPVTLVWTPGSACQLSVPSSETASGSSFPFAHWQDSTTATTDSVTAPSTSAVYTATFSYKPVGNLEVAADQSNASTTVPQSDSLYISGWAADPVDGSSLASVKVYVDGVAAGTPTVGVSRPDVVSYTGNSAYATSGYTFSTPAAAFTAGSHAVTVIATDSSGNAVTFGPLSITVTVAPPVGGLSQPVDSVTSSSTVQQADQVFISGWAADPNDGSPLTTVKVLIDGTSIGTPTLGLSRPDVVSATGKSTYANSGYTMSYNASLLSVGSHSVTVSATNSHNVTSAIGPQSFTVSTAPIGGLSAPIDATTFTTDTITQGDQMFVYGWAASYYDNAAARSVQIFIDGSSIGTATEGQPSSDVQAAYPNQAWGAVRYNLYYSTSTLTGGGASHVLTAVATDSLGNTTTLGPVTFTVQ
jgi:hypothetical protein